MNKQAIRLLDTLLDIEEQEYPTSAQARVRERSARVRQEVEQMGTDRVRVVLQTNLGQETYGVTLDTFNPKGPFGLKTLVLCSCGMEFYWRV